MGCWDILPPSLCVLQQVASPLVGDINSGCVGFTLEKRGNELIYQTEVKINYTVIKCKKT